MAHIGCADSPYTAELLAAGLLLHEQLVRVATVTGFDVDEPALEQLRRRMTGHRFVLADVTGEVAAEEHGRCALVIAGEVLEQMASCFAPMAGRAGNLIINPLLRADHRIFGGPVGDGLIAVARASA